MSDEQIKRDIDMLKLRTRTIGPTGSAPSSGTLPVHTHAGGGQGGLVDAAPITYTPADLTDWTGSADPGNVDDALDQLADRLAASHVAVTLAADADTLLGLTGQQLTLDSQTANLVLAGPTTGAAADPTFRALVAADLPAIDASAITFTPADNADWGGSDPGNTDDALDYLAANAGGGGSITVKEVDGTPNVSPVTTIRVSNGTLTDDGSGQVTIDTSSGGGGLDAAHAWLGSNYFPENYPGSPATEDDEFDDGTGFSGTGNGLNARWAWRNQSTATATYPKAGWITISVPSSGSVNWRIIDQAKPSGSFTLEARLSLEVNPQSEYVAAGIVLVDGTNGDLYSFGPRIGSSGAPTVSVTRWSSVTSYNSTITDFSVGFHPLYYQVRYTSGSTELQFWCSLDGIAWRHIATVATDAVGFTRVGLGVDEENSSGATKLHCDYFRKVA